MGSGLGLWAMRLRRVRERLAAVLAERIHMSQEIHDTLLQGLVGVALQLDAAAAGIGDPASAQKLVAVRRRVEQYIGDAREAIRSLRSRDAGPASVWDSLERTGRALAERHGFVFDMKRTFRSFGSQRRLCEQQFLRIGQEALTNVAKHAHATRVHVEVEYTAAATILRVSDDGCGFAINESDDEHFGVRIMRERAQQVGGHFDLSTAPGRGASITVTAPLF
jgi:signal transduction histidine kinase